MALWYPKVLSPRRVIPPQSGQVHPRWLPWTNGLAVAVVPALKRDLCSSVTLEFENISGTNTGIEPTARGRDTVRLDQNSSDYTGACLLSSGLGNMPLDYPITIAAVINNTTTAVGTFHCMLAVGRQDTGGYEVGFTGTAGAFLYNHGTGGGASNQWGETSPIEIGYDKTCLWTLTLWSSTSRSNLIWHLDTMTLYDNYSGSTGAITLGTPALSAYRIGTDTDTGSGFWDSYNGFIDLLYVWNRALPDSELSELRHDVWGPIRPREEPLIYDVRGTRRWVER